MKKITVVKLFCLLLVLTLSLSNLTACKKNPDDAYSSYIYYETVSDDSDDNSEATDSTTDSNTKGGNTSKKTSGSGGSSSQGGSGGPGSQGGALVSTPGWTGSGTLAKDEIVNMNGYTFTILSPLLPTKLNKNATLFEELLFERSI